MTSVGGGVDRWGGPKTKRACPWGAHPANGILGPGPPNTKGAFVLGGAGGKNVPLEGAGNPRAFRGGGPGPCRGGRPVFP